MGEKISYSADGMRAVASQMLTDAHTAIGNHDAAWRQMDNHLQSYPDIIQGLLRNIVEPHQKHLRSTYEWQISFANALKTSADQLELADQNVANEFTL
ncbi:hypothetical protein [Dictyobacter aurantiacus]|uniref:Uncharacterized protein n=1 Tax=Dictyobacter aurantiacus TaxID=1936993 RepID=A0A401ZF71_9CHLR|nr:hypothetical protein [Dictyobacter aurantiacus]GCE05489.1 hypothetical protein KDAU_28180 [Dictyobacter aurantiacus]